MMKKILIIVLGLIFILGSCQPADVAKEAAVEKECKEVFQLFSTSNMWTFLKLDTRDGRIWMLQYDVKGDNRMEEPLNGKPLVATPAEPGRFTLCPTQNMYTFLLLDQSDGRVWQIQWSWDSEYRLVMPINQKSL